MEENIIHLKQELAKTVNKSLTNEILIIFASIFFFNIFLILLSFNIRLENPLIIFFLLNIIFITITFYINIFYKNEKYVKYFNLISENTDINLYDEKKINSSLKMSLLDKKILFELRNKMLPKNNLEYILTYIYLSNISKYNLNKLTSLGLNPPNEVFLNQKISYTKNRIINFFSRNELANIDILIETQKRNFSVKTIYQSLSNLGINKMIFAQITDLQNPELLSMIYKDGYKQNKNTNVENQNLIYDENPIITEAQEEKNIIDEIIQSTHKDITEVDLRDNTIDLKSKVQSIAIKNKVKTQEIQKLINDIKENLLKDNVQTNKKESVNNKQTVNNNKNDEKEDSLLDWETAKEIAKGINFYADKPIKDILSKFDNAKKPKNKEIQNQNTYISNQLFMDFKNNYMNYSNQINTFELNCDSSNIEQLMLLETLRDGRNGVASLIRSINNMPREQKENLIKSIKEIMDNNLLLLYNYYNNHKNDNKSLNEDLLSMDDISQHIDDTNN